MVSRVRLASRFNYEFIKRMSWRAKLLGAVWLLFAVLVLFGIHGSSTGITSSWWMPEKSYTGFLINPPASPADEPSPVFEGLHTLFMANDRYARWDEFTIATPWALSQFAHKPKFPVINTNYGYGQNMLISPHNPVLHVVT